MSQIRLQVYYLQSTDQFSILYIFPQFDFKKDHGVSFVGQY